jgi:hypothetical protein
MRQQKRSYRIRIEDLLNGQELDTAMVKWLVLRRDDGATLFLSSKHGKQHARQDSRLLGIESLFSW